MCALVRRNVLWRNQPREIILHVPHPSETAIEIPAQTYGDLLKAIEQLHATIWPELTEQASWELYCGRIGNMFQSALATMQVEDFKELACFPAFIVAIQLCMKDFNSDMRKISSSWVKNLKQLVAEYPDEFLPYVLRGFMFIREEIKSYESRRRERQRMIYKLSGIAVRYLPEWVCVMDRSLGLLIGQQKKKHQRQSDRRKRRAAARYFPYVPQLYACGTWVIDC